VADRKREQHQRRSQGHRRQALPIQVSVLAATSPLMLVDDFAKHKGDNDLPGGREVRTCSPNKEFPIRS
jgi:hypothetical protein